MQEFKLIDPVTYPPPKERPTDPAVIKMFGARGPIFEGSTVEQMVADMDETLIETAIITAAPASSSTGYYNVGQRIDDRAFDAACREVADIIARYPVRFYGCAAIDPTGMMKAVRQLERAIRDYGFVGCFMLPGAIGLPHNHPCYFPIYAKCVELNVPVRMNVGLPGFQAPASVQRPIHLDEVLLAFPELTVIGAHIGSPWQLEVIALLQKHSNFYLLTSGWAPKYVPPELWQFANSRGANKLLWASDYPLLSMQRCASEGRVTPLKDEVKRRLFAAERARGLQAAGRWLVQ